MSFPIHYLIVDETKLILTIRKPSLLRLAGHASCFYILVEALSRSVALGPKVLPYFHIITTVALTDN